MSKKTWSFLQDRKKVAKSAADYADTQDYAEELSKCFRTAIAVISGKDLPNETMYYNIDNRLITPRLENLHEQISEVCMDVRLIAKTDDDLVELFLKKSYTYGVERN